jgi:hypothetical protein
MRGLDRQARPLLTGMRLMKASQAKVLMNSEAAELSG